MIGEANFKLQISDGFEQDTLLGEARAFKKKNLSDYLRQTGLTFLSRMAEHSKSDLISSVNRIQNQLTFVSENTM